MHRGKKKLGMPRMGVDGMEEKMLNTVAGHWSRVILESFPSQVSERWEEEHLLKKKEGKC